MFRFAISSLRLRKASAVGSFLALLCAAAIICASGVLLATGIHGAIAAERYSGTPVVVAADQQVHWTDIGEKHGKTRIKTKSKALSERAWLPGSVGGRLAKLPGARVAGDLIFPADVVERDGSVLPGAGGKPSWGHGWSSAALTPYALVSGTPPYQDDDVVLDTGLASLTGLKVGDQVVIESTSAPKTYRVAGIARPDAAVNEQSAMFFDAAEARRLSGHDGMVAAYGVFGVTAGQVRSAVAGTGALVWTGSGRGQAEFPDATSARAQLTSMGGAIGGTALIVAVLVVAGTFALSIQQRHRELALMRAVGATAGQVRRMAGREALLLGLAAGIPGALLGLPLASVIHAEFVSLGAIPGTLQLARSPFPVIVAVAAAVGAAWAAARVATQRIARIRPVEALAEAAAEHRAAGFGRVLAGLICTALAVVVTVVLGALHTEPAAIPVTYLSVLLWMITVALLGPFLARAAVMLLGGLMGRFPVSGFLATRNSRANNRRVASVITPLALFIGMTSTILFVPATISNAAQAQTRAGMKAGHLIESSGPGVPASAARALRAVAGVSVVTEALQTTIWVGEDKRSAEGLTPTGLTQVLDPGVTSGSLDRLGPGTIAMSDAAAQGRHIGDIVHVTLGDGVNLRPRLVAIYTRGLGFGDTLLNYDDIIGHVNDPLATAILIKGSVTSDQLRARIKGFPGLTATDGSGYQAQAARQQASTDADLVFLGLIIAFTGIAVINTLAMATGGRTREIALMRLIGATRRQVLRTLRWELALVVGAATVLGSCTAWLTLARFSMGMAGSGAPGVVPRTYALILVGATALGLAATMIPARMMLRRNPAEDINASQ